jgi:hypothetical protein
MGPRRRLPAWVVAAGLLGAAWPGVARAFSNVEVGATLENPTLATLDGGRAELLSRKATASLFVFFRPQQDRSQDALQELESIRQELSGRPVRFVAVVSGEWPAEEVRAAVRAAGVAWPVLVDAGDALYGRLGVRLHPVVGIADRSLRLVAYEHYRRINFREIVLARLRVALGELAEADMAKVLEPEKATTGTPQAEARRHYNLARKLWARKNAEKALESVKRSLAVVTTGPALALQGEITAAGGDCAAATPLFEQALKIDPAESVAIQGLKGCARPRP